MANSKSPKNIPGRNTYYKNSEKEMAASYGMGENRNSFVTRHSSTVKGPMSDKDFADLDIINELKSENMRLKHEFKIIKAEKIELDAHLQ